MDHRIFISWEWEHASRRSKPLPLEEIETEDQAIATMLDDLRKKFAVVVGPCKDTQPAWGVFSVSNGNGDSPLYANYQSGIASSIPGVSVPKKWQCADILDGREEPRYPMILARGDNERQRSFDISCGKQKWLIENPCQLEILRQAAKGMPVRGQCEWAALESILAEAEHEVRHAERVSLTGGRSLSPMRPTLHWKSGDQVLVRLSDLAPARERAKIEGDPEVSLTYFFSKDMYEFREYINTPTEHHTNFRVVLCPSSTTRPIVAVLLQYAPIPSSNENESVLSQPWNGSSWIKDGTTSLFEYDSPKNPFFLRSRDPTSNRRVSNYIPLWIPGKKGIPCVDPHDRAILAAHGIDPDAPFVPTRLLEISPRISERIGRLHAGDLVGVDILQNARFDDSQPESQKNAPYHFLECQALPGRLEKVAEATSDISGIVSNHYQGEVYLMRTEVIPRIQEQVENNRTSTMQTLRNHIYHLLSGLIGR